MQTKVNKNHFKKLKILRISKRVCILKLYFLKNGNYNEKMFVIVGLGNPEKKYKNTRHNIGFEAVNKFAEKNNFPEFKFCKELNASISEKIIDNEKIILAKPQTFMNNSGLAVKKIISKFQIPLLNLIVVHDDIDLPLGKIKVVKNRGAAGHRGVKSIIKELESKDFIRFRIGIMPLFKKPENMEKFVLQNFKKDEKKVLKDVISNAFFNLKKLKDYLKRYNININTNEK